MRFNYDEETNRALEKLRETKSSELQDINERIRKMKDEIADQLALFELYKHRAFINGQSGWEVEMEKAKNKASNLEDQYGDKIKELDNKRLELNFDLEALNEIIRSFTEINYRHN
ncbi:hypothetical protein [Desulfosporosinus sp. FKA]|uniref:hypothetical protein n=1 Tax=Desulfosporosinus sp. FKA TaxID=1969834 RepID=UPI000B4A43D2|nr:hypothetical protein [Desulfosporosinus sp. FKA]